jgi:micrococcal nuclease
MFQYRATIIRVIDGDTVEALVDLGFRITTTQRLRLYGINAPELHKVAQIKAAKAAKAALEDLLPAGADVTIETSKSDDWGRWLATIIKDGENINKWMVKNGYAVQLG